MESETGVNVTASTDKTGGTKEADWVMETDEVHVIADYFHPNEIAKWREEAFFGAMVRAVAKPAARAVARHVVGAAAGAVADAMTGR